MQAMLALLRMQNADVAADPFSRQRRDMAQSDRLIGGNQIHGFANMVGFGTAAPAAVRRMAVALRRGML